MKNSIIVLGLFLIAGCAGVGLPSEGGGNEVADKTFYQHWVHSFEEQGGKQINIFRPSGSREFPAARFRMEFGFDPSGQCNYKYLSPSDAHEMRNCVFTKIGRKVYIYDEQGKLLKHISFTLVNSTSKDEMRMKYGVQAPSATAKKDVPAKKK